MVLLLVNRHICIALTAGTNKHLVRHAIKQAEAATTLRYGPMSDAQMQQAMQQVAARATNFPQQQWWQMHDAAVSKDYQLCADMSVQWKQLQQFKPQSEFCAWLSHVARLAQCITFIESSFV